MNKRRREFLETFDLLPYCQEILYRVSNGEDDSTLEKSVLSVVEQIKECHSALDCVEAGDFSREEQEVEYKRLLQIRDNKRKLLESFHLNNDERHKQQYKNQVQQHQERGEKKIKTE